MCEASGHQKYRCFSFSYRGAPPLKPLECAFHSFCVHVYVAMCEDLKTVALNLQVPHCLDFIILALHAQEYA